MSSVALIIGSAYQKYPISVMKCQHVFKPTDDEKSLNDEIFNLWDTSNLILVTLTEQ